jgi:hypothetical protein
MRSLMFARKRAQRWRARHTRPTPADTRTSRSKLPMYVVDSCLLSPPTLLPAQMNA